MKLYGYVYYNHNLRKPQWRTLITKNLDLEQLHQNENIEFPYDIGKVTVMKLYNIQEYNFNTNEKILSDCYANPQWFTNHISDKQGKKYSVLRYLDAQKSVDLYIPWPNQDPKEWEEIKNILEYRFIKGKGRSTYTYRPINIIDQFPNVNDLTDITTELLIAEIQKLSKSSTSKINNLNIRFALDDTNSGIFISESGNEEVKQDATDFKYKIDDNEKNTWTELIIQKE